MSYATLTTAIETKLATAAATMTNPSVRADVVAGEPISVDRPTVAYWFDEIRTWESNTLGATQEQWVFAIRAYYPLSGRSGTPPRAQVEQWIGTVASAIRSQFFGDVSLGGEATGKGLDLSDTKFGHEDVGVNRCRVAVMDLAVDMANVATIASST